MSWDLWAYRPDPADTSARHTLGTVAEVRSLVEQTLSVEWQGPFWCLFQGEEFTIEINVGDQNSQPDDPVDQIEFEVRGGGDPLPVLAGFARQHGLVLEDLASGELLDLEQPSDAGWKSFQAARDCAVEHAREKYGAVEPATDAGEFRATRVWYSGTNDPIKGTIAPEDLELLQVCDRPREVVDAVFAFYESRGFEPSAKEQEILLEL